MLKHTLSHFQLLKISKKAFLKRIPIVIFLLAYLIWVGLTYPDYGVAIDEPLEYGFGEMMYNRTFGKDPQLMHDFAYEGKDSREIWAYNHFHKMFLYIFNDDGSVEIYHLLNMLFASLGFIVSYEIILVVFQSSLLAFLGPLFLATLPRFFGDLPANVKDPVFAIYYLLGLFAIIISPKIKPILLRVLLLGLTIGLAAAFRTVGYSLIIVYLVSELPKLFNNKQFIKTFFQLFASTLGISMITIIVHAIEMPFVASNPIPNLLRLMQIAKEYPWDGNMLYMGNTIMASSLPWHYPLIWAGVVTPFFILLMGFISLKLYKSDRSSIILAIGLAVNIGLYYILQPIIYDGIRHLLYILVIFTVLAAIGFGKLYQKGNKYLRFLLIGALLIHTTVTFNQYRILHPYEYVYFNEPIGFLKGAYGKFETDYWGVSYFEGARWLKSELKDEGSYIVGLCGNSYAEMYFKNTNGNTLWIPTCENIKTDSVDYVMAMGRNNEWDIVPGKKIHEVSRDGIPLMKIFKLQNNKIVDQKNQTQSKVIFDSKSQAVTFSEADTNFQLNTHYSNSDLFDFGISHTGRFASTNILPNSQKSQIEVVTFDFETESFLTIDNKFSSMLRQIGLENDTTTVKHYWSPTDDELFLLVIGMYQKSRLFKLHVDDSNTKLVLEKEFSFPNSQDISVDGWSKDGVSFSISIIEEVENVPNTGAIRVIKTRNANIFKDNSYRYEDE